jgi:uncharacterized RDD family membrane protein YckC
MSCTNHPAVVDNLRPCERCSRPFCPNCLIVFQGKRLCGTCKNERIRAVQSGTPEGELQLGTVGRRLGAVWLDGLVMMIPIFVLIFGLAASGIVDPTSPAFGLINLLVYGVPIVYEGFFLSASGQTPGKKWLGLKVVNPDGSDITAGQAWGRAVGKTLINLCMGIGYLPALFTKEKTTVHDMLAKTRVIKL